MKVLVIFLLAILTVLNAKDYDPKMNSLPQHTAYGYITRVGIPLAQEIENAEKLQSRISGGQHAKSPTEFPYQAGLLLYVDSGKGVCGASLINKRSLVTAAHCWNDGRNQVKKLEVVLGSTTLYTGGTRINTTDVVMHPNFQIRLIRNDIAVIHLPMAVNFSDSIAPVALPSGDQLKKSYAGTMVVASGYGRTRSDIGIRNDQSLSYVNLTVITNEKCKKTYGKYVQPTNICISGLDGKSTCRGDSGGPVVSLEDNVLVGITSFNTNPGCEQKTPTAFTRVTSYVDFINNNA